MIQKRRETLEKQRKSKERWKHIKTICKKKCNLKENVESRLSSNWKGHKTINKNTTIKDKASGEKRGEKKITIWHLPPVCSHDGFHNLTVYIRCALHNHFFHLIRKISIWRGRPQSRARVMSCLSPLGKDLPLSQSPPLFILFSYSSTYLFH